jgi:hypothetical protein
MESLEFHDHRTDGETV